MGNREGPLCGVVDMVLNKAKVGAREMVWLH